MTTAKQRASKERFLEIIEEFQALLKREEGYREKLRKKCEKLKESDFAGAIFEEFEQILERKRNYNTQDQNNLWSWMAEVKAINRLNNYKGK